MSSSHRDSILTGLRWRNSFEIIALDTRRKLGVNGLVNSPKPPYMLESLTAALSSVSRSCICYFSIFLEAIAHNSLKMGIILLYLLCAKILQYTVTGLSLTTSSVFEGIPMLSYNFNVLLTSDYASHPIKLKSK